MRHLGMAFLTVGAVVVCGCLGTTGQTGMAEEAGQKTEIPAPKAIGRIVFSSDQSGDWRIWSMKEDGSDQKQLADANPGESDVDPMYSPDGTTVLFTSTRGGKAGLWKMPADGGEPQRICDGDQAEWAPDGKNIVFRRAADKTEAVFRRNIETGEEKKLTPDDWPHCSAPAWSPDGKTIAFAARWDAGNGLYLIPAEGGAAPTKVYDQQGACEPHWSADCKTLVFETTVHICTVKLDVEEKVPDTITPFGGVQRYGRYSPDGKMIIFCQGRSETGPWQIYTIPAEGGSPKKLTGEGSNMYPDWR